MANILALDIGGANIKVADGLGYAHSWPFALWKTPEKLAEKIASCLAQSPPWERIVVTMTGELCDCFETKREGVRATVEATLIASRDTQVSFYLTTGRFVSADEAIETYLLAAASNWHALATFAARYCEGRTGALIDIGSTTTDIIPINDGKEVAAGRTDHDRLLSGELVYTGVERSPLCAVVSHLPFRGTMCPVAQEFFATTADAYLVLGDLPEDSDNCDTADGRPFTRYAAHSRLARMICSDGELLTENDTHKFADAVRDVQLKLLEPAFAQVIGKLGTNPDTIVTSGHGEFLARRLLNETNYTGKSVSLNNRLGHKISRCAPAHALAVLAREQQ